MVRCHAVQNECASTGQRICLSHIFMSAIFPGDHIDHRLTSMTSHIRRSLVIVYIICGWLLIAATFHSVASRIAMQKKKRHFKLSMQSRTASMIFRHNQPGATSNHPNSLWSPLNVITFSATSCSISTRSSRTKHCVNGKNFRVAL